PEIYLPPVPIGSLCRALRGARDPGVGASGRRFDQRRYGRSPDAIILKGAIIESPRSPSVRNPAQTQGLLPEWSNGAQTTNMKFIRPFRAWYGIRGKRKGATELHEPRTSELLHRPDVKSNCKNKVPAAFLC